MPESERTDDWAQARAAMQASFSGWATVRVQGDRALVTPSPDLDALFAGLEQAQGGGWAVRYAVDHAQPPVVRATLQVGAREREGLASGHTLHDARLLALADVLRAYGVLPASSEAHWVEYDPEEGANTHELEPPPAASAQSATRPPEPPKDPQLDRARKHIDDLLEGLRDAGLGPQVARVLARRGYGNTLEESREVYKELKALKG